MVYIITRARWNVKSKRGVLNKDISILDNSLRLCYYKRMENPIRVIRKRQQLTLEEMAAACGVHLQAVYLNERGCYHGVLPVIRQWIIKQGYEPELLDSEYIEYQTYVRKEFGKSVNSDTYQVQAPTPLHPFIQFRTDLGQSRMGIAKVLAVHPAGLYRLERAEAHGLSGQLKIALHDAGFRDWVIQELDYRCGEFAEGHWSTKRAAG